jgi:hypothetical protein
VRALEAARGRAKQALLLLQWASRDRTMMLDVLTNLERNVDEIARLATDPAAVPIFRRLATETPTSGRAAALVSRLTSLAVSGYKSGSQPLELTVTPSTKRP